MSSPFFEASSPTRVDRPRPGSASSPAEPGEQSEPKQPVASSAHASMLARERRWAARNGLALDPAGHLTEAGDGLCLAPRDDQHARLARHPDRPLGEPGKPGSVVVLGTAWALAVNLIEAIPTDGLDGLLAALGAPGRCVRRGWLHAAVDHGAASAPVVRLDRDAGTPVFVEVCGAELALGGPETRGVLRRPADGWGDLEGCRRVAIEAAHGCDAPRTGALLARLRTLTRTQGRRGFRYVVVRPHFDPHFDGALRRAFDGLRMRIGGEVDFDALDLATLLPRLARAGDGAHPALGWLVDRYLDGVRRAPTEA